MSAITRVSDVTWMSGAAVLGSIARATALISIASFCPRMQWSEMLQVTYTMLPARLSSHSK